MKFRRSNSRKMERYGGKHRFEHWYRDNTVYFITARCREGFPAFESEAVKAVFWDRLAHYAEIYGFVIWVVTLLDNHYHVLGYLREGKNLGVMMRKLHGSVAKLVNDVLPERLVPFWTAKRGNDDYFDGCIRDEGQCRKAYRYTLTQSERHGVCRDWTKYPHTKMQIESERGVKRAREIGAFLRDVRYARYERGSRDNVTKVTKPRRK